MTRNSLSTGLMAGVCGVLLAAQAAFAQTSPVQGTNQPAPDYRPTSLEPDDPFAIPRTPDGRPDFQGVVWDANAVGYLQGPGPLAIPEAQQRAVFDRMLAPFKSNPEYVIQPDSFDSITGVEGLPLVRGERRTRLLVQPANGRLPLTDEARKELASVNPAFGRAKSNDPEDRNVLERCLAAADLAPIANMFVPGTRSFIQTNEHIVVHLEYGDEARIIPFAGAGARWPLNSTYGEAVARWEGDTLVIETTNLPAWQRRRLLPAYIINADAKVIERYTRVSESELLYQFTIEDPKVYSAPWLAEYSLHRAAFRMYPQECHEGNYSLPNILRGQRVADGKAATR